MANGIVLAESGLQPRGFTASSRANYGVNNLLNSFGGGCSGAGAHTHTYAGHGKARAAQMNPMIPAVESPNPEVGIGDRPCPGRKSFYDRAGAGSEIEDDEIYSSVQALSACRV